MIREKTTHRQPTLASDLVATAAVLSCVIEAIRGYSKTDAARDFSALARASYGHELDDTLTVRLPQWLFDTYGVTVEWVAVEDAYRRAKEGGAGDLNVLVSALRDDGWDAERLLDGLIHLETAHHNGLVLLGAGRIARNSPQSSEEFMSYGWLGLRVALRKFDPALGHRFSTYAMTRITGAIRDGVRDEDPLPKRLVTERNKAVKVSQALAEELGRTPTLAELSDVIGENLAHMLPRLGRAASLEELETTFTVVDSTDVGHVVETSELVAAVNRALADLDPTTRTVAELVLRDGVSVRKAAEATGVSAGVATTIVAQARTHLAGQLAAWA